MLEIKNLNVSLANKKILFDINLIVKTGARQLLIGDNGSGKTTLASVIAGNPDFKIDSGQIIFNGIDITYENATTRSLLGIFLGGQNVPEIPGLSVVGFLKHAAAAHAHFNFGKELVMGDFLKALEDARTKLDIPKTWLNRSINVGFSGGERKRLMLIRLLILNPRFAILDEPDSGADALLQKTIADTMNELTGTTFLFISHQEKFKERVAITDTTCLSLGKVVI